MLWWKMHESHGFIRPHSLSSHGSLMGMTPRRPSMWEFARIVMPCEFTALRGHVAR